MTTTTSNLYTAPNPATNSHESALDAIVGAVAALARRAGQSPIDPRDLYLSKAVDHEDCEQRARAWEQHEQQQRQLPPVL